jgi:hypothetical protein
MRSSAGATGPAGLDRRSALGFGAGAWASAGPAIAASTTTRATGLTFLQSLDPNPDDLCAFLAANWLAMDEIARLQGLLTNYSLHVVAQSGADWNVLVQVGYPDPAGYAAIADRFEVIRRAHVVQPIGGRMLRDLGRIVRSVQTRPVAQSPA